MSPAGVLPQQAQCLDARLPIRTNEILIDVQALNIDSASFHQIKNECRGESAAMERFITELVAGRGKHQNPVTGSGGMLIGTVREIGCEYFKNRAHDLKPGDRIATLVSLTLTPLSIDKIKNIHMDLDRVDIAGHAILFESGIYARLPDDIPDTLSLAVLDVCGAPAQTAAMCFEGATVVVIGGGGKSGLLCLYEAKKKVGPKGRVIALDYSQISLNRLRAMPFVDHYDRVDARNAVETHEKVSEITGGRMADIVINVANIPDTEMATVLSARSGGTAYFFNMATSFTRATLGAEGTGSHVTLIMGNGYRPGHAELGLQILRESREIRELFEGMYGES